jgi:hypothetical protein
MKYSSSAINNQQVIVQRKNVNFTVHEIFNFTDLRLREHTILKYGQLQRK